MTEIDKLQMMYGGHIKKLRDELYVVDKGREYFIIYKDNKIETNNNRIEALKGNIAIFGKRGNNFKFVRHLDNGKELYDIGKYKFSTGKSTYLTLIKDRRYIDIYNKELSMLLRIKVSDMIDNLRSVEVMSISVINKTVQLNIRTFINGGTSSKHTITIDISKKQIMSLEKK